MNKPIIKKKCGMENSCIFCGSDDNVELCPGCECGRCPNCLDKGGICDCVTCPSMIVVKTKQDKQIERQQKRNKLQKRKNNY